ncbi:MAG: hypothetical protein AAFW00_19795 [Bacteroidota bacterium]
MKNLLTIILILAVLVGGYWYLQGSGKLQGLLGVKPKGPFEARFDAYRRKHGGYSADVWNDVWTKDPNKSGASVSDGIWNAANDKKARKKAGVNPDRTTEEIWLAAHAFHIGFNLYPDPWLFTRALRVTFYEWYSQNEGIVPELVTLGMYA